MSFTAEEKMQEAARELKMRTRVYVGQIECGNMTAELAARRIAIMSEIMQDYEKLAQSERLL